MALTKALEAIDEWAVVAAGVIREGAAIDVSPNYETMLHIVVALSTDNTASTGGLVIVQTRAGAGDEDWRTLTSFGFTPATANMATLDAQAAATATLMECADATGFDTPNTVLFVKNAAIANSEIVRQTTDAEGDEDIDILDGLKNIQEIGATVFDKVDQFHVAIPFAASTCRVLIYNSDDDCAVTTRTDLEKVTALT